MKQVSGVAQTCAALAAFVGAVGLYRLQILRDRRSEAEFELRRWSDWLGRDIMRVTLDEISTAIDNPANSDKPDLPRAKQARSDWAAFLPRVDKSRRALIVFEGWNLLVIGLSLVGFNHIPLLVSSPSCTFWGLLLAAVGTVAVTVYCVYAWTRG